MYSALLAVHVVAGFISLVSGFASAATKGLPIDHAWHKRFGNCFFFGMCAVFATALPMTILLPDVVLLLVALASFYLAATGWRAARNRNGIPSLVDYALAVGVLIVSVASFAVGVTMLSDGNTMGLVLCVVFVTGTLLGRADLRKLRTAPMHGHERIAGHALRMMIGTIAALTAFLVNNFTVDPEIVLWLGPFFLIGPFALWWSIRIKSGASKDNMRQVSEPDPLRQHLRKELKEHLEEAVEALVAEGMSQGEASAKAIEDLGESEVIRDGMQSVYGPSVTSLCVQRAMKWKDRRWHLAAQIGLVLTIVLANLFVYFVKVKIVPKLQHDYHELGLELLSPMQATFHVSWFLCLIVLGAAVGFFQWTFKSENKTSIRTFILIWLSLVSVVGAFWLAIATMVSFALLRS